MRSTSRDRKQVCFLFILIFGLTYVVNGQTHQSKQDHIDVYKPDGTFNKSIFFDYYEKADEMPQYPGGEQGLRQYIEANTNYSEAMKSAGVQGKVVVRFIVSPTGNIMNIKTLESPPNSELLVREAQRLVQRMPKWTPGKEGGKPVYTEIVLPILFNMK